MARNLLALALVGLALGAAHGVRPLTDVEESSASRRLLDVSATAVIQAVARSDNPSDPCVINSISGPGPDPTQPNAYFNVPMGQSWTVLAQRGDSVHSYQVTGINGNMAELSTNSDTSGFVSATFTPQAVGDTAFVQLNYDTGVSPYFNSSSARPLCTLQITFSGIPDGNHPSPPPPSPTPTPTPPAPGACSGAVPCYCQNSFCFNNGATLTTSCAPPAGQTCSPVTVAPSAIGVQYAYGYPATVNVCQCQPSTSG